MTAPEPFSLPPIPGGHRAAPGAASISISNSGPIMIAPLNRLPRPRRGLRSALTLAALAAGALPSAALHAQIWPPEIKSVNEQHVNVLVSDYSATLEIAEPLLTMPSGDDGEVRLERYLTKMGQWRDNYKYVMDAGDPSNIMLLMGDQMHDFSGMYPYTTVNGVDYDGDGQGNGLGVVSIGGAYYWQYLGRNGTIVNFDANLNAAISAQHPSGLTSTWYYKQLPNASPPTARIQSVVQSDGTMIKYTYDTDDTANTAGWFHVASVAIVNQAYVYCDPMADHCAFSLSAWPSATFSGPASGMAPSGQTAIETSTTNTGHGLVYRKDMYGRVVGISDAQGSPDDETISYGGALTWGVTQVVNGRGDVRTYNGTVSSTATTLTVSSSFLNSTEVYTFPFAAMQMPTKIVDRAGRQTLYEWSIPDRHLTRVTHPEGNYETYQYDGRFNIIGKTRYPKPGSGSPTTSESAIFDASCASLNTCNLPNAYIDARGNRTDFTYTTFGKRASELKPAPSLGAARPLRLYTYVQKSAYVLNASGALVSTGQPIWKLATETSCQTYAGSNALVCDPAAVRTDTTYIYGADGTPNNLLVRGKQEASGGVTRLTCYGYDRLRHRISETSPNANLQVCP
jgi:YD repeat-containing protein